MPFRINFKYKTLLTISLVIVILFSSTLIYVRYRNTQLQTDTNTEVEEISQEEDQSEEQEELETTEEEEEETEEVTSPDTTQSNSSTTNNTGTNTSTTEDSEPEEEDEEEEPVPESPSAYVAYYADNQSDTDAEDLNHERVVNYILATGANPIFHGGDLMEDGTQDSLDRFNTVTSVLRPTRTFYAALGNNDRKVGDSTTPSQLFLDNFTFPNNEQWYSVNVGNLHMVILDSAFSSGSSSQLAWLSADLQSSASQDRITGVIFHHPSFATTISSYLIDYGVDFVVSGHLHTYSHTTSSGINYFVLSGQPNIGYMTAKIYSEKVVINSYNSSNGLIESVEIKER